MSGGWHRTPWPAADNRQVLVSYSEDMKRLLNRGYKAKKRPSGHNITSKFGNDLGGAIPSNLVIRGNNESNSDYIKACADLGVGVHPARFPSSLPEFFLKLVTRPGDIVLDPFAGSNTTGRAAEGGDRRWLSIDIEDAYVRASAIRFGLNPRDLCSPSSAAVVELLRLSFADLMRWPRWPKPLHLVQGALLVEGGADVSYAAKVVGTTVTRLMEVATAPDVVRVRASGNEFDLRPDAIIRLRRNVGQLVLGRAAEIAFQDICEAGIDPNEFSMTDVRQGRTNTDFRLLNGGGRPLYRFNVKFFRVGISSRRRDGPLVTIRLLPAGDL